MTDAEGGRGESRGEAFLQGVGKRRSLTEIEQGIGRARAEIDLTLWALEHKLAAHQLVEDGVTMMKQSLGQSELWSKGLDLVRANPFPVVLIGVGAAWLLASSTGVAEAVARDERTRAAGRRVAELASDVGARAVTLATDAASRVGIGSGGQPHSPAGSNGSITGDADATHAASGAWVQQAGEVASGAMRSARETSEAAFERAMDYAKVAGEQATRVSGQVTDTFERHPLLIGGIGLIAGALIGALLPGTRTEDAWVGSARDKLLEKAEVTSHQAVQRLREAAQGGANDKSPSERGG